MAVKWRVVLSRWMLYVLAVLPGMLAMSAQLDDAIGKRPWFHDATLPLNLLDFRLLLSELSGSGLSVLMFGAAFIWLMQLAWQAGAMRLLDPAARSESPGVFGNGRPFLGRFVRIAIFALIAAVLVHLAVKNVHESFAVRAELEGWSVRHSYITLQMWRVLALFAGLSIVGVFAFWVRVITVAGDRRYLKRIPRVVLRLFLRRPVRALLLQFVAITAVLALQATALWNWRQSEGSVIYLLLWAVLLLLAAYVWQLRIQSALTVWNDERSRDLRQVEDRPWRFRYLRR
ncbi:MAG: hypothetical protein QNJ07_02105 [Woeseiaceae bacterium]|nr:hypothetical protein [Woeseiaceae bacterium]